MEQIEELLASNRRYVFFARNPDNNEGPCGSLNVPLTACYSVTIDPEAIPDGSPLVRLVAAQDTGGAIAGEVRADIFWGAGDAAGDLGRHAPKNLLSQTL